MTIQSIAINITVVFAFKKDFDQTITRHKLRQHHVNRFLTPSTGTGGYGLCCAAKAFNSEGSPSSGKCGDTTRKCKRKKKKTKGRVLFNGDILPDLFEKQFDEVVNSYTALQPEETRGILDAHSTRNVAACAVSRFVELKLDSGSFGCTRYSEFDCSNNEDILFKSGDTRCEPDQATQKCKYTPINFASKSTFTVCCDC
jgi:hypothetical protein